MRGSRYRGERISGARARGAARLTPTPHCSQVVPAGGWACDLAERRQPAAVKIGRPPHTPRRAVNGGQGFSFLSGLVSGAPRPGGGTPPTRRGARPSFAPSAAGPRAGLVAPGRGVCAQPAPGASRRAILGAGGEVPMSQIAPAVGTAPARRLRRPATGGCGSEQFMPGALLASCGGALDRRANLEHHPATTSTARSRSALATSNHSDMAAH
jgi:hypothetical protein